MTIKHVQLFRGSLAFVDTYTGPEGEVVAVKDDWTVRIQDGVTPGGFELAKKDYVDATFASSTILTEFISSVSALAYSGDWADIINKPTFALVATSGDYDDLINTPAPFSGVYADLTGKPALFSGAYADLTGKPGLFDGSFASLTGIPAFADIALSGDYDDLINAPVHRNSFTSEIGLAAAVNTFTHNLAHAPATYRARAYIKCTATDAGYAVNDVVELNTTMPDNADRMTIICHNADGNSTAVIINGGVNLPHKSTRANTILTLAKWNLGLQIDYYP